MGVMKRVQGRAILFLLLTLLVVFYQCFYLKEEDVLEIWPHNIKFKRNENPTFYNDDFEKIFKNLNLPAGCNVVDIGANSGDTSFNLAAASGGGTVVAFEMGPPIDLLRQNVRMNPHLKID